MEEYIVKKDTIDLLKNIGAPQYAINAVDVLVKPVEFVPLRHAYWEKMPSNGLAALANALNVANQFMDIWL